MLDLTAVIADLTPEMQAYAAETDHMAEAAPAAENLLAVAPDAAAEVRALSIRTAVRALVMATALTPKESTTDAR